MAKIDIYQAVTDRILETLDKWDGAVAAPDQTIRLKHDGLPRSMNSKKPYRGVNIFLLAMTAWAKGYESAYWLTYKQAKSARWPGSQGRKVFARDLLEALRDHGQRDRRQEGGAGDAALQRIQCRAGRRDRSARRGDSPTRTPNRSSRSTKRRRSSPATPTARSSSTAVAKPTTGRSKTK